MAILGEDWSDSVVDFVLGNTPANPTELQHMRFMCRNYKLVGGTLYKGALGISRLEGQSLLEDIHKGECSTHASPRALAGKAFRQVFFWPTAFLDALELVRRCDPCQHIAKMSQAPQLLYSPLSQRGPWHSGASTSLDRCLMRLGVSALQ